MQKINHENQCHCLVLMKRVKYGNKVKSSWCYVEQFLSQQLVCYSYGKTKHRHYAVHRLVLPPNGTAP